MIRFNTILSFMHINFFILGFLTRNLFLILTASMLATCHAHFILFHLTTLITNDKSIVKQTNQQKSLDRRW